MTDAPKAANPKSMQPKSKPAQSKLAQSKPAQSKSKKSKAGQLGAPQSARNKPTSQNSSVQTPVRAAPVPAAQPVAAPIALPAHPRCGFIAVIGAPNAGKSTLVNTFVGTKVTIVSHKVQTTRMAIRGIAIAGDAQLVFIDTPGIFKPRRRLDRAMVKAAWGGAGDADVIVFLFDAHKELGTETREILNRMSGQSRAKRVLALNKVDQVKKVKLFGLASAFNEVLRFDETFMISALSGSGVDKLKAYLAANVPAGDWHYPPDDISDLPERSLAAEITREKLFNRLHEELPYATTVETTAWTDLGKKGLRIEQTIFVGREGQRGIVLGDGGTTIKQISVAARKELCVLLERDVHLFLHVKVMEGWENDPARYREMGLEFPKE
jgi:GTPase